MAAHLVYLSFGAILLASILVDIFARRFGIPRVSLLVLLGIVIGPMALDLLPETTRAATNLIAQLALVMVAFLLGGELSRNRLQRSGRQIMIMSVVVVVVTALLVAGGLILIGVAPLLALLLAGVATATDPAATRDVVKQKQAKGKSVDTLVGVVAIDDAWGVILFGLLLALAGMLSGLEGLHNLLDALWHVGGAVVLGVVVGVPAAFGTGLLRPGEPTQAEAIGVVLLVGGLALWLDVSYLLAAMVAGVCVANLARHHTRSFREIEHVEWPFLVFFFVLSGASLDGSQLLNSGVITIAFIALRILGRFAGGWLGGKLSQMPARERNWFGLTLMPQAGIALGMALVGASLYPALTEPLMAITIASVVVFETLGPLMTALGLRAMKVETSISP